MSWSGGVWKEDNADSQCECVFRWSCDLRTVQQCWRLLTVLHFPETYTPLVKGSLQPVMKCWYKDKFSTGCLYVYLGQIAKVSLHALVPTQGNRISYPLSRGLSSVQHTWKAVCPLIWCPDSNESAVEEDGSFQDSHGSEIAPSFCSLGRWFTVSFPVHDPKLSFF